MILAISSAVAWIVFLIAGLMMFAHHHKEIRGNLSKFVLHMIVWSLFYSISVLLLWPLGRPLPPLPIAISGALIVALYCANCAPRLFVRMWLFATIATLGTTAVLANLPVI